MIWETALCLELHTLAFQRAGKNLTELHFQKASARGGSQSSLRANYRGGNFVHTEVGSTCLFNFHPVHSAVMTIKCVSCSPIDMTQAKEWKVWKTHLCPRPMLCKGKGEQAV